MSGPKKLGVDVDGVIADFSGKFLQLANKRFGTEFTALDQHDWDFKPWFTKEQVDAVWELDIKPTENFWAKLMPLPGVGTLKSVGQQAELFFITSRVPTVGMSARGQTCAWLRNWFYLTFPTVIVVDSPSQKVSIAKALELGAVIDDKIETVVQMHEAGIRTYCKLTPYNSSKPFSEGVLLAETLDEFLERELKDGE